MNKIVLDYLKNKQAKLCVLATASKDGSLECAVVGYAIKDDGAIIISTDGATRKIKNILENRSVALTVGWTFGELNVQYEGKAEVVDHDHPEYAACDTFFFSVNLMAKAFKTPDTIFIRIIPVWVRVLDLTVTPPTTEEFTFTTLKEEGIIG